MKILLFLAINFSVLTSVLSAADLATVGDVTITSEQFQDALKSLGPQGEMVAGNPEMKKRFLDHMINSRLVAKQARKEGFESDAKYKSRLKDLSEQLLAGEYMDRTIEKQATEANLKKYFNEHKNEFSKKEVKASHALVDSEDEAKKILVEVSMPGADFDAIAKKHSKDKSVDLGYFGHGRMVPEFEQAAFATAKGKIHDKPVKTQFGWHIIKVTDIKGDQPPEFTAVKAEVTAKFRANLQEKTMADLRQKTTVKINEAALKDLPKAK